MKKHIKKDIQSIKYSSMLINATKNFASTCMAFPLIKNTKNLYYDEKQLYMYNSCMTLPLQLHLQD